MEKVTQSDEIILGRDFLRQVYTVLEYDQESPRIGLAPRSDSFLAGKVSMSDSENPYVMIILVGFGCFAVTAISAMLIFLNRNK